MHLYEPHNIMGKLLRISDDFTSEANEPNLLNFLAGELLWPVNVRRPSSTIALKAYSSFVPGPIDSILGRKYRGDL